MRRMFTVLALAAMVFSACSKDEKNAGDGVKRIAIDPTIGNPALVPPAKSTRASDTDFEQGDAVGLMVTMAGDASKFQRNMKLTYDEATKTFASETLWYEDVNMRSSLYAYYPYVDGDDVPTEFSVQADQSGDGYAKSDLIVAVKADVKPTVSATAMTFKHKMTRIVVDVNNESGFDVTEISIGGAVGTGTIDLATGAFTAKADAVAADVKTHESTKNKLYYALLVPQNGVKLLVSTTTADGKKRTYTLGTTDLKSGENRRMDLNVQPAEITVKFSGPIDAWVDGDELLPDGEGSIETPTVEWGGVKYEIVTLKDGRTWMAENLRYIPAGKTPSDDPTVDSGIWYPQQVVADGDGYKAVVSKDADYIAQVGYYYDFATAVGVDAITEANSATFEGAQGICPDGWHIPTAAEFTALLAAYVVNGATYWADLDKDGFNSVLIQNRRKNTSAETGAWTNAINVQGRFSGGNLMSSTKKTFTIKPETQVITTQNTCLMFMDLYTEKPDAAPTINVKVLTANSSNLAGIPMRCIKDKE